jgi:transmembrane 9 superfamily protein 2/4
LAVSVGTGIQILLMLFLSIIFSIAGFLSPVKRGSLLVAQIVLYILLGSVAGYTTARIYKTFKGKSWQHATMATAFGFPGICFLVFFILNIVAKVQKSTDAVPIQYMILLLFLWLGISTPLVFFGAYLGFKQEPIDFPVTSSGIPRQIPDQPWFMNSLFVFVVAGLLPFLSCFFELYFIMSSIWMDRYYYIFGLLFVVFLILLVTCCETTILFTYFQLCGEDYHWWWRSFCTSGSVAFYILVYSFKYFNTLHTSSFATYFLYHSYMTLASLAMFLMTGAIGMLATLWFNKVIFSSVKID